MTPTSVGTLAPVDVVRKYVEAFNDGDFPAVRKLFTRDGLVYGVLGWGTLEEIEPLWRDLHDCLGVTLEIQEMIAQGDSVAARLIDRGTARRPFRHRPATGRSYEVAAMEWFEFRDGRIRRRWGVRDTASQFRQLDWEP